MFKQKTLKEPLTFEGVGIHTGEKSKIILHPERENTGIRFLKGKTYIPAHYRYVVNTNHSTDLGRNGEVVKTVEHLLASLHLLGITNLTVEVIGPEVPILDGSGYHFYRKLKEKELVQEEEITPLYLNGTYKVVKGDSFIEAKPCECLEITYEGEFNNFLGKQSYTFKGSNPEEIVYARTFCFDWEIDYIRSNGLGKGGNLTNTLVLGRDCVYNPGGMRYTEEPVRHKVFDLVGDLYLLGRPVRGKFFSRKGGHTLNYMLVLAIGERVEKGKEISSDKLRT